MESAVEQVGSSAEDVWRNLQSSTEMDSYKQFHNGTYIAALVLATMGVISSLVACLFVFLFRHHRIVKLAQPPFLYLVCFGCALLASSLYFVAVAIDGSVNVNNKSMVAEKEQLLDVSCVSQTWLQYSGDVILYMALFSKLWRVHKVTQFRRQQISVENVMIPFMVMLLGAVAVLIAWTIQAPPTFESLVFDSSSSENSSQNRKTFGMCYRHPIYNSIMTILIVFSGLVALWMSYKIKNVQEDISDSRCVQFTLLAHLVTNLLATFMVYLAHLIQSFSLLTATFVLAEFCAAVAPLGFLILPKMYCVAFEQVTGELPDGVSKIGGKIRITGLDIPQESLFTTGEGSGTGTLIFDNRKTPGGHVSLISHKCTANTSMCEANVCEVGTNNSLPPALS